MANLAELLIGASPDDAVALTQARAYTEQVLKPEADRMVTERRMIDLLGFTAGDVAMTAIEDAPITIVPARIKTWFTPSELGIDIAAPYGLELISRMLQYNVVVQAQADVLTGYAYNTVTPFAGIEMPDVLKARGVYAEEIALPDNQARHILTLSISNTLSSITRVQVMQRFGPDIDSLTEWHECASFVGVKYSQSVYRCSVPESQGVIRQLKVVTYENLGMSVA